MTPSSIILHVDETFEELNSSEDGLSDVEVAERSGQYGANELGQEERINKIV
jgi:magnesium-transporting ATPase (P-type)